jgi:hypothetical protein
MQRNDAPPVRLVAPEPDWMRCLTADPSARQPKKCKSLIAYSPHLQCLSSFFSIPIGRHIPESLPFACVVSMSVSCQSSNQLDSLVVDAIDQSLIIISRSTIGDEAISCSYRIGKHGGGGAMLDSGRPRGLSYGA